MPIGGSKHLFPTVKLMAHQSCCISTSPFVFFSYICHPDTNYYCTISTIDSSHRSQWSVNWSYLMEVTGHQEAWVSDRFTSPRVQKFKFFSNIKIGSPIVNTCKILSFAHLLARFWALTGLLWVYSRCIGWIYTEFNIPSVGCFEW